MASITTDKSAGRRIIQFVAADGKRRSIRLGKVSQRQAEAVKVKVEDLAAAVVTGHAPSRETAQWVANLDPVLHDKLAAVALVARRERATLAAFIDCYSAERMDVKQSTRTVYDRTRKHLVDHFGPDKPLRSFTPGDADAWRLELMRKGLAENTIRRTCGIAKQFFTAAVRRGLIDSNPFAELTAAVRANSKRFYFVTRSEAQRVLGRLPGCGVAAAVRPGPLRRIARAVRSLDAPVVGCRLGA